MQNGILPVILSGGSGTRLWPASTADRPKQFLPLLGPTSLLQATLARFRASPDLPFAAPLVVCGAAHADDVHAALDIAGIAEAVLVLEPAPRNTAPCAAVAALLAAEGDPQRPILMAPSDHHLDDVGAFRAAVLRGVPAAAAGELVIFGIVPTRAETGYGYIRRGGETPAGSGRYAVEGFVEKPPADRAEAYLASGEHFWNAGLFLFTPARMLAALEEHRPDILEACRRALATAERVACRGRTEIRLGADAFAACPPQSLDHAVMEVAHRRVVIPLTAGWSDVGSWLAVWDLGAKDARGNVADPGVILVDAEGCLVRSDGPLVALAGVKDLVVVVENGAVLVTTRQGAQAVRKVAEALSPK